MNKLLSRVYEGLHWRLYFWIYYPHIEPYIIAFKQWRYVKKLRKKDVINVVFFPMNVAMWKYQHLYELLRQNQRFRLYVFLAPASTFSYETRCSDMQTMRSYFGERNVPFVDFELEKGKEPVDVCSIVEPDLLFYAQPYEEVVDTCYRFPRFKDKLLCHIPYGFSSRDSKHYNNNLRFNNLAWKLYYQTVESEELAKEFSFNKGRNVVVVGYPSADDYVLPMRTDPWKIKNKEIKRIIWAPHFTILAGIGFAQMSNFLNMAEYMQKLAIEYADKVTFAFKPHPRLYSELVKHPDWGEERTKEYFDFWKNSPTTQHETGDFVDLFKGSDAMIHDSGSFTVDYLYFNKPVLYDNPDIEAAKNTANETGKKAYDVHYRVSSNEDIKHFIDNVVLGGNDPMKAQREEYYMNYLLPPNGKTVAQNIYDDLVKSLF
jgi:CDP-glycerol glycerophosphotransferase (TagB/SpsB family)